MRIVDGAGTRETYGKQCGFSIQAEISGGHRVSMFVVLKVQAMVATFL
jgi:hypothetical protein